MAEPIRLYLDEDAMRTSLLRALRARQVDVTTPLEAQLLEQSDEAHLAYATAQGRVLFSFNRGDFTQLHKAHLASNLHHAGIIVSDQLETGVIVRRLLKLLHARPAEEMHDWLEFLSNWR
jgi:hypothetical protein